MSEIYRRTYVVEEAVPEIYEADRKVARRPQFDLVVAQGIQNILAKVAAHLKNRGFSLQNLVNDTQNNRGAKLETKAADGKEVEVMFMPNGEIMVHAESGNNRECQNLAQEIHQKVQDITTEVFAEVGLVVKYEVKRDGDGGGAASEIATFKHQTGATTNFSNPPNRKLKF